MKTALVTGIGAAVADRLRSDGYHVATTDLTESDTDFSYIADAIERTPVGRIGRPEDIAAACAFFLSEEAGYITGQIRGVNDGRNT